MRNFHLLSLLMLLTLLLLVMSTTLSSLWLIFTASLSFGIVAVIAAIVLFIDKLGCLHFQLRPRQRKIENEGAGGEDRERFGTLIVVTFIKVDRLFKYPNALNRVTQFSSLVCNEMLIGKCSSVRLASANLIILLLLSKKAKKIK